MSLIYRAVWVAWGFGGRREERPQGRLGWGWAAELGGLPLWTGHATPGIARKPLVFRGFDRQKVPFGPTGTLGEPDFFRLADC